MAAGAARERSRMARLVVIQGHPDPVGRHFCHALADAYAEAAVASGHASTRIAVAELDFPHLRSKAEFETGAVPPVLRDCQAAIAAADHLLLVFPLWMGGMPSLLKAFLEQVLRPGFAFQADPGGRFPRSLLGGKSARIVVTMGMPAFVYRWYFGAHGVRSLKRSILGFAGIRPVRVSLFGMIEAASKAKREAWLGELARLGRSLR
jgi:putative NADPH-quinone reductase